MISQPLRNNENVGRSIQEEATHQLHERRKMTEQLKRLAQEQEPLARSNPAAYRAKLQRMVWLAYGYVLLVALGAVAILLAIVAFVIVTKRIFGAEVKIFLVVLLFLAGIFKGLFAKIPKPVGASVTRSQAPALWAEVDRIADRAGAQRPAEIILDFDMNAAAVSRPRFGLLGGVQSILLLGVPLLAALSPDQARSVIAHEFGHFAGEHGKFGGRIYRLHEMLGVIAESSGFAFKPFFRWFMGRFTAMSFVLRRQQEYEADSMAAKLVGPEVAASALARLPVADMAADKNVWEHYAEQARSSATPPSSFMADFPERLRLPVEQEVVDRARNYLLEREADYDDSHPSFKDRAAGFGFKDLDEAKLNSWITTAPPKSALEEFVPNYASITADFVRQVYHPAWTAMHQEAAQDEARLHELDSLRERGALTFEQRMERADLIFPRDKQEGIRLYRELQAERPNMPEIQIRLAAAYLRDGDLTLGEPLMRQAIAGNAAFAPHGLRLIAEARAKAGVSEFQDLEEAFVASQVGIERAQAYMNSLGPHSEYVPCAIPQDLRFRLADALRTDKHVGEAYLATARHAESGLTLDVLVVGVKGLISDRDSYAEKLNGLTAPIADLYILVPERIGPWRKTFEAIRTYQIV